MVATRPLLTLLKTPASLMDNAVSYMLIFNGGLLAVSAYYTPFSILRALDDSVYSMMNGGIEIVARIAFVFILTSIPFIGMWGIFITTGLTWLVTALFALWRYKKGAWMNKSLV